MKNPSTATSINPKLLAEFSGQAVFGLLVRLGFAAREVPETG
jgi:hypothetical protein